MWSTLALGCDNEAPRCTPLRAPCDISSARCQAEIFRATACERGQPDATLPKVRVITRKTLRAELETGAASYAPTAQDQAWERASQLLQLLPPDQGTDGASVDLLAVGIAAYYSSASKSITVIDDAAQDKDTGSFTLSHEYMHALQDQREGFANLNRQHVDSTDSMLALDALTEGEATLLSNFVMLRAQGEENPGDFDYGPYFQDMLSSFLDDISESPAPLLAALQSLSYPIGGAGLADLFYQRGLGGIENRYDAPYTTLSSWIDRPSAPGAVACSTPQGPEGLDLVILDRLGAAGLLALDVVSGLGVSRFKTAPERWRGDLIAVFASPEAAPESIAVRWQLRLASATAAEQLHDALEALASDHLKILLDGREVQIAAAESAATLSTWDLTHCEPQKARQKGRSMAQVPRGLRERLGIVH